MPAVDAGPGTPPQGRRAPRRLDSGGPPVKRRTHARQPRSPPDPPAPGAWGASVVGAEPIPAVELEALRDELLAAVARQPREHGLERLLLRDAGVERVLAAQARRDLERLAPVLAERPEGAQQEVLVGDRRADLERGVPGCEHRQVMLVQVVDGLRVVRRELLVGDLVDPRADQLAQQLPAGLAADRLGDDADGVLRLDEAQGHGRQGTPTSGRYARRHPRPLTPPVARPTASFPIDPPRLHANRGRAR